MNRKRPRTVFASASHVYPALSILCVLPLVSSFFLRLPCSPPGREIALPYASISTPVTSNWQHLDAYGEILKRCGEGESAVQRLGALER